MGSGNYFQANPFLSLSSLFSVPGLTGGATGSGAGAAGLAGAAGAGFPWTLALMLLGSALPSILGGGEPDMGDKQQNLQETLQLLRQAGIKQPYQSPYQAQLDPVILNMLLQRMKRSSNWGWPSGMGIDTDPIMDLINKLVTGTTTATGILPGKIANPATGNQPRDVRTISRGSLRR